MIDEYVTDGNVADDGESCDCAMVGCTAAECDCLCHAGPAYYGPASIEDISPEAPIYHYCAECCGTVEHICDYCNLCDECCRCPGSKNEGVPRPGRYWGEKIGSIARKAARDHEYWYLGGGDGPDPIECALLDLREALADLETMRDHAHQWNDNDYCDICGADGRA